MTRVYSWLRVLLICERSNRGSWGNSVEILMAAVPDMRLFCISLVIP